MLLGLHDLRRAVRPGPDPGQPPFVALIASIGLSAIPDPGLGKLGFMVLCLGIAAAAAAFSLYLKRSWMGSVFDAVADDEDTARMLGIEVSWYKLVAFALGTAIAGVAGGLYAHQIRSIAPDSFGFVESISMLTMVVIGGVGSVWGVALAAARLTLLPQWIQVIADYRLLVFGALLQHDRGPERDRARQLLDRVGIGAAAAARPAAQPLGVLKRLEMARALALDPKVLLLDEPLAGLNHLQAARLADLIRDLNREGLSIVLIEHNLAEVLRISDRLFVLDNGRAIAEGPPATVIADPDVRAAYPGQGSGEGSGDAAA